MTQPICEGAEMGGEPSSAGNPKRGRGGPSAGTEAGAPTKIEPRSDIQYFDISNETIRTIDSIETIHTIGRDLSIPGVGEKSVEAAELMLECA